jgi:dipeptidyl aminopeptidase/acylaminoacyl peptidase
MRYFFCLILVYLLGTNYTIAQVQADLIPRSALFASTEKILVLLSPDGQRIGYVQNESGSRILYIADVAAPDRPQQVGPDTIGILVNWTWAYDNQHIWVIHRMESGDRLGTIHVLSGVYQDRTPIEGGSLQIIKSTSLLPNEIAVTVRMGDDDRDGLYRIHMTEDPVFLRLFEEFSQFYLDNRLLVRAARKPQGDGNGLYRLSATGDWVNIAEYDWEASLVTGVVSVRADGKELYITDNTDLDRSVLKAVDLQTGHQTILMEDPLTDLLWAGATIHPEDGTVQAVVGYFNRMHRHVLDPDLVIDFEVLGSVQRGDLSFADQSLDGQTWLVRYMDGGPLDYYLYDRRTKKTHFLFSDISVLDPYTLAQRHGVTIPARDGLALPADLYLPPGTDLDGNGRPDRPLPTILYVHGGPWVGFLWNNWFANRSLQLLANRGYAVLRTEFRGAGGYGKAFMDAGNFEFGGKMHTDLVDVADWAVSQGIADADKVGIWGWSYGGYATFGALAFSPDVFACGVSMYGLSDLEDFVQELLDNGSGQVWTSRVGDVRTPEGRDLLRRHSPLNYVDRVIKPILVSHGGQDQRAPQSHSDRFVEALENLGRSVTYLVYPDEPHDYRRSESWQSFWAVTERFLHEHLGGRYEPYGAEIAQAYFNVVAGADHIAGLPEVLPSRN